MGEGRGHILIVPYPAQGHINPMLQFSKRLVSKGVKVTLAVTLSISKSMQANTGSIQVKTFSDGYDDYTSLEGVSAEEYLDNLKIEGSKTLIDLINNLDTNKEPVSCVVYDGFLPWALDVAKQFGLIGAVFFTQSCAVNSIYYHAQKGSITIPMVDPVLSVPGLPSLEKPDLSSFISAYGTYPGFFSMVLNQFSNIEQADWILFNTFYHLEPEVVNWMSNLWPIRTIGPAVPSMFLDGRVEGDRDYGVHLFEPSRDECINWLNTKDTESVVYVSFGSMASLTVEQMEELAWGLKHSNNNFLWVVRATENDKLPKMFMEETSEKGLVVTWCPQLEVLSHRAVGCFLTHCGWNSTLEVVSLGIPVVAMPQWTDQPTNAKFLVDEWKMGLRVKVDDQGISRRKEIEESIKEMMEGAKGEELRKNAKTWKQLAKEAMEEGGTSDKNIEEFASTFVKHV